MLQLVHAGICSVPHWRGSMRCSGSEQDFLWNSPSPLLWTFLGQGLSMECCHLYPPHPIPMGQGGPQGSNVKLAGIILLMFASNACHYKKPSEECNGVKLLFRREMATKSGPSSSSSLHNPSHWLQCFFFPHNSPHPTPVPGSKSQQLPTSSPIPSPVNSQTTSLCAPALFLYSWSLLNSQCSASLLSQLAPLHLLLCFMVSQLVWHKLHPSLLDSFGPL